MSLLTSQRELDNGQERRLRELTLYRIPKRLIPRGHHRLWPHEVHMLEQLRKKPVERIMKADPAREDIKVDGHILHAIKFDVMKTDNVVLVPIKPVDRERADTDDLAHDELDGVDERLGRAATVRLAIGLNDTREGERDIKHVYPRVGLVLNMAARRALVGLYTNEQRADVCELGHVRTVGTYDGLHARVGAEITNVREDGHVPLAPEWVRLDVHWPRIEGRLHNAPFRYLVGEKGCDELEEAPVDILVADHCCCNTGNGEQFQGKEFDRGFSFAVDEEIGIDDTVEDIGIADG